VASRVRPAGPVVAHLDSQESRVTVRDRLALQAAGTDYGHADSATELRALEGIRNDPRLDPTVVAKILCDNPRSLYSL